jgi:hypothetical protein
VLSSRLALATDYHVATTGSDSNGGTSALPFKTIQKAADVMVAGDTCTVHEGTYREWVRPRQGGTSDTARIVYRAAPGETVYIKGSEAVTAWTQDSGAYKAVVPNTMFGSYNPYSINLQGGWLQYGSEYHLGGVYIDGEPLVEALDVASVASTPKRFYAEVGSSTTIWASFGKDPSGHLVEINVRESAIQPETLGLAYITIDGFHIMHGAPQWSPPTAPQFGLVNIMQGHHWLIQNNYVSDARTVGIMCGTRSGGTSTSDITKNGNHVVRNNTIQRCGEAGIAGENRWPNSLIENNLIEDINWTMQFGGYETAGIKIHDAIDVVIRNNVIRRVRTQSLYNGFHEGIWLDWAGQGSRITGNVIYDVDQHLVDFEMDHGPQLVDNNILVGNGRFFSIKEHAENGVYVHNLMVDVTWEGIDSDTRSSGYWTPHTTRSAGSRTHIPSDDRLLNNIYVRTGTDVVKKYTGYQLDYNVFYEGASPSSGGTDAHSLTKSFITNVQIDTLPNGVRLTFVADSAPRDVQAPLITRDLIGINSLTKQGIEYHDGSPITIDKDMLGVARSTTHPTAGPFESAPATKTSYVFTAGVGADTWGATQASDGGLVLPDGAVKPPVGGDAAVPKTDAGGRAGGSPGSGGSAGGGTGTGGATSSEDDVVVEDKGGCGCRSAGSGPNAFAWLACAVAVAMSRRRGGGRRIGR